MVGKFTSAPRWMRRLTISTLPCREATYRGACWPCRVRTVECHMTSRNDEAIHMVAWDVLLHACLYYSAVPYWPLLHEPVEDPPTHHVRIGRQSREVCTLAGIKDINSTRSIHQTLPLHGQRQSHVSLVWAHLYMYMHQWPIHCDDHALLPYLF